MELQTTNRNNVETTIRTLLLWRGAVAYMGLPMEQLDNDYYNKECMRIPFEQLGHCCLLDFLQTLTDTLIVECEYGTPLVYPILDEHWKEIYPSLRPTDCLRQVSRTNYSDAGRTDATTNDSDNVQTNEKSDATSLAAFYNELITSTRPVPSCFSLEIINGLIPDTFVKLDETVTQMSVTELKEDQNDIIKVVVVEVCDPSVFWIQVYEELSYVETFLFNLDNFYEVNAARYRVPNVVIAKGLNCACKFADKWNRGIITYISDDRTATILLYDYGTLATFELDAIYYLHRSFINLPAQAICCGLYNIKPLNTAQWLTQASVEFFHKTYGVPLVATIAQIHTENNSMLITLTDTKGKEHLNINDWLVDEGYAEYDKMGETVRPNDGDESMEASSSKSTLETPECKHPTLNNNEEEAYPRSGNDLPVDSELFNSSVLLWTTWCMDDIKESIRRGIPLQSRVRSKLEELKNFLTTELAGCTVPEISTDDRSMPPARISEPKANDVLAVERTSTQIIYQKLSLREFPQKISTNPFF